MKRAGLTSKCPCHKTTKLDCIDPNCQDPCHDYERWNGLAWVLTGRDRNAPSSEFITQLRFGKP